MHSVVDVVNSCVVGLPVTWNSLLGIERPNSPLSCETRPKINNDVDSAVCCIATEPYSTVA